MTNTKLQCIWRAGCNQLEACQAAECCQAVRSNREKAEQAPSKEQVAFEAWLNGPASGPTISPDNPYRDSDWRTQHMYEVWRAAWDAYSANEPGVPLSDDQLIAIADQFDSTGSAGAIHRYRMRRRDMIALLRSFAATVEGIAQDGAVPPPVPDDDARSEEVILAFKDALRYRRLQILGVAPAGSTELKLGLVMRFTNLDAFVDADIKAQPSRGEYSGSTKAPECPNVGCTIAGPHIHNSGGPQQASSQGERDE